MRLSLMRLYVAFVPVAIASAVALVGGILTGWKW
jgi:hypothetical protein